MNQSKFAEQEMDFKQYQNFYSQDFNTNSESMNQSKIKLKKRESIFEDIASQKQNSSTSIEGKTGKFNRKVWN